MIENTSSGSGNANQAAEAARQAEAAQQATEAAAAQAAAAANAQAALQNQAVAPAPQEQRVASTPATDQQITAKKDQLAAQQALVDKANTRADATNNPQLKAQAGELAKTYDAREKSALAADVYHYGSETPKAAPVGWLRGSEHPELLSKVGLTNADLAPKESEFRAEVYFPDPRMGNAETKPVISYKGTTPSSAEDWISNFSQGTGNQTQYYDRAMAVAMKVESKTDGNFEITGHSLGGGLASAASAVTGAKTTTFNAAGLHPDTAKNYLAQFNRQPINTDNNVRAYQVEGELLTSLQESASELTPKRADQVADIVHRAIPLVDNPVARNLAEKNGQHIPDLSGLMSADGSDLRGMQEAAGEHITMPAVNKDGTPRPYADPLGGKNGIIASVESKMSLFERTVDKTRQMGAAAGNAIVSGSKIAGDFIHDVGRGAAGFIRNAGSAANDTLDHAGNVTKGAITRSADTADKIISGAGSAANQKLDAAGRNVNRTLDQGGSALRGALDRQGAESRKNLREFGEHAGPIGGFIGDGIGALAEFGNNATGFIADKSLDALGAATDKAADLTGDVLQAGSNLFGSTVKGTGNVAGNVANKTLDVAGDAVDATTKVTSSVVGGATNLFGKATSIIGGAVGKPVADAGGKIASKEIGVPIGVLVTARAVLRDAVLMRAPASAAEMVSRHSSYGDSIDVMVDRKEAELKRALR